MRPGASVRQKRGRAQERYGENAFRSFVAKPFMKGKSLKRDFPEESGTRELSKVVVPLDNQRLSYSSPPYPLSVPAGSFAPRTGRFCVGRPRFSIKDEAAFFASARTFACGRRRSEGGRAFGRVAQLSRRDGILGCPPDVLQADVPPELCRSCCRPCPRLQNASPASRRDLLPGECARSCT